MQCNNKICYQMFQLSATVPNLCLYFYDSVMHLCSSCNRCTKNSVMMMMMMMMMSPVQIVADQ